MQMRVKAQLGMRYVVLKELSDFLRVYSRATFFLELEISTLSFYVISM